MKGHIGTNIKAIRELKGLTQSQVSCQLGYRSSSMLSEIESGKKGLDAEKIPLLAKILGVNINHIFFGLKVYNSRILRKDELKNA